MCTSAPKSWSSHRHKDQHYRPSSWYSPVLVIHRSLLDALPVHTWNLLYCHPPLNSVPMSPDALWPDSQTNPKHTNPHLDGHHARSSANWCLHRICAPINVHEQGHLHPSSNIHASVHKEKVCAMSSSPGRFILKRRSTQLASCVCVCVWLTSIWIPWVSFNHLLQCFIHDS